LTLDDAASNIVVFAWPYSQGFSTTSVNNVRAATTLKCEKTACASLKNRWTHVTTAGGVIKKRHSADVEYPPHPPCVCMSIHPELKPCSDLGRVLVLNDPPTRCGPAVMASLPSTSTAITNGKAAQAEPMKPTLTAPIRTRLKLSYVHQLFFFAFCINLRRYNLGGRGWSGTQARHSARRDPRPGPGRRGIENELSTDIE
jgi:hypothetical protein